MASSVTSSREASPVSSISYALRQSSNSNACGVWTALSLALCGVAPHISSSSMNLTVSLSFTPGMQALYISAPAARRSISSGVTMGLAPSCMSTIRRLSVPAVSLRAFSPSHTESYLCAPPLTTARTLLSRYLSTMSCFTNPIYSVAVTITTSSTQLFSMASRLYQTTGLVPISMNCFGMSLSILLPRPAARTIA